ncbi:hypothetical protein [Planktotalea sp.]|uniref:hypothetical protein n=1 Tax=Planktotalea sp. TaxID=2029877 RepID=UPI003D6B0FA4
MSVTFDNLQHVHSHTPVDASPCSPNPEANDLLLEQAIEQLRRAAQLVEKVAVETSGYIPVSRTEFLSAVATSLDVRIVSMVERDFKQTSSPES